MIKQEKEKPLNIYRASAGSGKTHLLTGFYIKLLFLTELMPETHSGEMKFSEILAVTFTNKATAEMKTRIIEELHLLNLDPRKSDYWEDLTGLKKGTGDENTARAISDKAEKLLIQILNEYSQFNISTIDSFFQRIVRSFARELNIPGNYEVELNADKVLEAAVTNFLDKLDARQDPKLFEWMTDFTRKRMEEGSGWDMKTELLKMARGILTSETYRTHSATIRAFTEDKEALRDYAKMLRRIIDTWRTGLKEIGQAGLKALTDSGLTLADFSGGASKSPFLRFNKWAEGEDVKPSETFFNWADDPKAWFKKKSPYAKEGALPGTTIESLQSVLQRGAAHFSGDTYCFYLTAVAIHENFYELGILANIDKEIIEYCNEQNFMLLSSTTEMLARLIRDDDAPFIYEKTGTRIHSYMIDEFQDTSGMQWGNFKPLISNALSEQYQNLIVGDVKQSIYRWRGGDWGLLDSKINEYETALHRDDTTSLRVNWRSLPAIVNFNNTFFPDLARKLDEALGIDHISRIYADVTQQLPPFRQEPGAPQGLVHIEYLEPKDEEGAPIAKPNKEKCIAEARRRLPEVVIKLQQNGFQARDIAVLCRYNKECQWAAEALLQYKQEHPDCPYIMDIISGEALVIGARPCIQALVSLMRHLLNPDSPILRTVAWSSYMQLKGLDREAALEQLFSKPMGHDQETQSFHPELAHRPLYEMTEELIGYLPAEAQQQDEAFLQAFRDLVLEYTNSHSSDLNGFLSWWDDKGSSKSISTPEGQNAILIMSVHKSKGLGMPAVIMPFASWNIDIDSGHKEFLWCEPKVAPFKRDVLLPLKLDKKLEETIFREDFIKERECAVIDNLNTVYVAFTRAKEAMVILTPKAGEEGMDLKNYLQAPPTPSQPPMTPSQPPQGGEIKVTEEDGGITWGNWQRVTKEEPSPSLPPSPSSTLPPSGGLGRGSSLPRLSILHDPAKPDITAKQRGNYIHAVLQEIRTADEADAVIERLYKKGLIDTACIPQTEMHQVISQLLSHPDVAPWFRPGLTVLNELTLMDENNEMLRPDRIIMDEAGHTTVIDYKTGKMRSKYATQVRSYMQLLKTMGFKQVQGWLLMTSAPIETIPVKA